MTEVKHTNLSKQAIGALMMALAEVSVRAVRYSSSIGGI